MKKVLALVLAFAMMFSTITVAFAETEVSAEAKALATVGMLEGDGNGVTAEYTAKEMTRFTAAISLLKLKGLYNDALAFKGDANFADVDTVKWAEGKNILAYLKANPGLGFGGNEKGEFNPNGNINEQSYYKVLLETLGYKQTTAEVAGDFAWAETLEFAAKVGLKPVNAATFTVDALAKATVAALKANMKDGKVLINVLVDGGKVDKAKAVAAELYVEKEEPVRPAVEDKVAPKVTKVEAVDTDLVEVTFDRNIEKESGEDVGNYEIVKSGAKLEISSAKVNGKKVTLTTVGMENLKIYTITIKNVRNASGVVMATKVSKTFKGVVDNKAPKLDSVKSINNIRLQLMFNEELNKEVAENVGNYTIKAGSNELAVESARLMKDSDKEYTIVELITAAQKGGTKYTLEISNIVDDSVSANVIAKPITKEFYGKTAEKSAPTLNTTLTKAVPGNKVLVVFKDANRLNFETATDINNYTFNNNLSVEAAEMLDEEDLDCMTVLLTTDDQDKNKTYSLTVKNVADELGNAVTTTAGLRASIRGIGEDIVPPYIVKSLATDTDEVEITFDNMVTKESAENVANYDLGDLGTPEKAVLNSARTKVTLTTGTQVERKWYDIKVSNIEDLAGNAMSTAKANFVGYQTGTDVTAPKIDYVEIVSKDEARIHFTEPVKVTSNTNVITFTELDARGELTATTRTADFVGGLYNYGTTVGGYLEDGSVLQVKFNGILAPEKTYKVTAVVNVKDFAGNNFKQNFTDDVIEVSGVDVENEGPTVISMEQTYAHRIQILFSENVDFNWAKAADGKYYYTNNGITFTVSRNGYNWAKVRFDAPSGLKDGKEYTFNLSSMFTDLIGKNAADDEDVLEDDYTVKTGYNKVTKFETYAEDTDAPEVVDVVALDTKHINVEFNEPIKTAGTSYRLTYKNENGAVVSIPVVVDTFNNAGDEIVPLMITPGSNKKLSADYTYTLEVNLVKDYAGNTMTTKAEVDFVGTDVEASAVGITNVEVLNAGDAYVYFGDYYTKKAITVVREVYTDANGAEQVRVFTAPTITDRENVGENEYDDYVYQIEPAGGVDVFFADGTFEVVTSAETFRFTSTVDDGGLYIGTDKKVVYSDITAGDVVKVYDWAAGSQVTTDLTSDTVATDNQVITAASLTDGDVVVVTVERNGVIVYAAKVKFSAQ